MRLWPQGSSQPLWRGSHTDWGLGNAGGRQLTQKTDRILEKG